MPEYLENHNVRRDRHPPVAHLDVCGRTYSHVSERCLVETQMCCAVLCLLPNVPCTLRTPAVLSSRVGVQLFRGHGASDMTYERFSEAIVAREVTEDKQDVKDRMAARMRDVPRLRNASCHLRS